MSSPFVFRLDLLIYYKDSFELVAAFIHSLLCKIYLDTFPNDSNQHTEPDNSEYEAWSSIDELSFEPGSIHDEARFPRHSHNEKAIAKIDRNRRYKRGETLEEKVQRQDQVRISVVRRDVLHFSPSLSLTSGT